MTARNEITASDIMERDWHWPAGERAHIVEVTYRVEEQTDQTARLKLLRGSDDSVEIICPACGRMCDTLYRHRAGRGLICGKCHRKKE